MGAVEILDVSVPVRPGMITYPGDPVVRMERVSSIAAGAVCNLTRLDFGTHSGTHVDAPVHFVDGGAAAESLPLDVLVGPARVLDFTGFEDTFIGASDLAGHELGERIRRKTRNSKLWERSRFDESFASLDGDAARALIKAGVRLVGIDYLSIGDGVAHEVLLEAGVVAIEGLDLRQAEPGEYQLVCAPLKLVGSDGAPARVLLLR
jgi:arylformamidase